jgi:hypothetical protein
MESRQWQPQQQWPPPLSPPLPLPPPSLPLPQLQKIAMAE